MPSMDIFAGFPRSQITKQKMDCSGIALMLSMAFFCSPSVDAAAAIEQKRGHSCWHQKQQSFSLYPTTLYRFEKLSFCFQQCSEQNVFHSHISLLYYTKLYYYLVYSRLPQSKCHKTSPFITSFSQDKFYYQITSHQMQ